MKGDLPAAALRLLNALPVRTHEWDETRPIPAKRTGDKIQYGGKVYASRQDLMRGEKVGYRSVDKWVREGKAVLVK